MIPSSNCFQAQVGSQIWQGGRSECIPTDEDTLLNGDTGGGRLIENLFNSGGRQQVSKAFCVEILLGKA
jgi:hypothetical protein